MSSAEQAIDLASSRDMIEGDPSFTRGLDSFEFKVTLHSSRLAVTFDNLTLPERARERMHAYVLDRSIAKLSITSIYQLSNVVAIIFQKIRSLHRMHVQVLNSKYTKIVGTYLRTLSLITG